jgi:serine/threonine protein kinase
MNATSSSSSHRQKDNYSLGPVQGEGRFAVVRECHHKMSGQQYSLRIISKARVFGQEDLVWRECEVLRCMRHENLVKVVDGWDSSDDIYMVVEHVEVYRLSSLLCL